MYNIYICRERKRESWATVLLIAPILLCYRLVFNDVAPKVSIDTLKHESKQKFLF